MRLLLVLLLAAAAPAWAQDRARPVEGMSGQQLADYRKLVRGYIEAFALLGRSRFCRLDFDAGPYFREVVRRHGEESEPVAIARAAYDAGVQNLPIDEKLYPAPPALMPCDVVVYMRGMSLPPLPSSLALSDGAPRGN